jgi:DNA-binding SARP family transcriptional activator/tetratricopeptide (TPR) repeat protein
LQFGVLGSLVVHDDAGRALDLGGNQARTVLAVRLAAAGRVVTAETLVDVLWGDDPPASAPGTLQSYVSRLRRELEPGRNRGEDARILRWEPPGYRLAVDAGDVDFRRFEALADQGRALLAQRPAESRDVLLEADALWRGPALVEYRDKEFAIGLVARLEDRRMAATEDRIAAELALGRHAAVAGELAELVKAHPLQEGLWGSLALALYRSGRQSEALRALSEARETLRDELGVDLGRPLRDLESAILAHDPSLDPPAPPAVAPMPTATPAPAAATSPGPPAAVPPGDHLVGREAELAQLLTALDEASRSLRVALIEGEPGIGKTRLAEEIAAEAARRGAQVLWGRTFEGGAAPALWPWLPPLRTLVATLPEPTAVAPELANLVSTSAVAGEGPTAAMPARFALVEAVADLLMKAAVARPVVLVLDDLQWADVESLELLTSVVGRLAEAPLLIVGTVRELEVGRNDSVVSALAVLTRSTGARRLQLRGLAPDATDALVAQTAGGAVDPAATRAIHARAEGNPFFTTELARLVAGGHGLPAGDVPSGVRDVVRRRLALLPERTADLLRVAAVIGRDVDLGLLAAASGRDLDECLDDLEPAILHRLLVAVPDQPGVYRFAHALVREVVVDDVSSLRRARLHLKVADALDDVDDNAEILAEHLWQAVPIGVGTRAAAALERAARVAVRRLAYTTAQDLLERAVQLRRTAAADPAGLEAELKALAFLVSVVGAHRGYPAVSGSPLLARGKWLAGQTGSTVELLNLLWAEWAGVDVSCQFDLGDPIAEELLAVSERADVPVAPVLGHTAYGISRWHHGDLPAAAEHLDAARQAAAAVPAGTMASVLLDLDQLRLSGPFSVYIHDLLGDLDDPEASYEELVRRLPGDRYWVLLVSNFAASGAISTGDLRRAERAARRGLASDPEGIFAFWSTAGQAYLGATLALQGNLDDGLPLLDRAWASYTAMGLRTNGVTLLASRTQALAQAGRLEAATASLAEARRELATYQERYAEPTLLLAEAVLRHARGDDPAAVAEAFSQAADLATAQGARAISARVRNTASGLGYTT